MHKLLLALLLPFFVWASEVEVLTGNVDVNGSILTAYGDVVLFYEDMLVSAHHMRYDRDQKLLDLWGEVHILKGALYYALGDELHLDLKNNVRSYLPLFLHEKTTNTWMAAKKATAVERIFKLKNATVSSCHPEDPDWRMEYSSGTYDSEEKWMNMFNVVLYAGQIPFFYLPYVGFSTDDTRRSGLLMPSAGWSEAEGWFYEQPLYIVLSDGMDMELRYQYRELRGEGYFLDFRFVDSPTSRGHINLGYFTEQNDDAKTFGWVNEEHKGLSIDYTRTHLFDRFIGKEMTDDLFVDIDIYNDIDYVNLQLRNGQTRATQTVSTSRINYSLNANEHYLGVYAKYFFDSRTLNDPTLTNDETLQELPKVQYHSYVSSLFTNNLTYSVDLTSNFKTRPLLTNSIESAMTVPIAYTLPLFNEYLNVTLTENIVLSSIAFHNIEPIADKPDYFEGGEYLSSSQQLNLNSDLIKKYENNTHALRFGASYLFPGFQQATGFYENKWDQFDVTGSCKPGDLCEFTQRSIDPVKRQVNLDVTQYLYNRQGAEWFYHKMTQPVSVEDNVTYGTLENEMRLTLWGRLTLYNDSFYSNLTKKVEKMSSSIGFVNQYVTASVTNLWQNNPTLNLESDYYTYLLSVKPNPFTTISGNYAYDNMTKEVTNWQASIAFLKRCWSFTLRYAENIIPTSADSIKDRFIYVAFELRPFGGVDYEYRMIEDRNLP